MTNQYLTLTKKLELIKYDKPVDRNKLKQTYAAFSGTLRRHPHDPEKIILLAEPMSNNTNFYEFNSDDIGFAENLPNIVNTSGEDIPMVMLWIKKESVGIRCAAFIVDDVNLSFTY